MNTHQTRLSKLPKRLAIIGILVLVSLLAFIYLPLFATQRTLLLLRSPVQSVRIRALKSVDPTQPLDIRCVEFVLKNLKTDEEMRALFSLISTQRSKSKRLSQVLRQFILDSQGNPRHRAMAVHALAKLSESETHYSENLDCLVKMLNSKHEVIARASLASLIKALSQEKWSLSPSQSTQINTNLKRCLQRHSSQIHPPQINPAARPKSTVQRLAIELKALLDRKT